MRIGEREIGPRIPPYVIAEIGVNHDGSAARALELVEAARAANADAVKLQFFETDRLMSRAAKLASYQKDAGEADPIEMLRRLELSIDEMAPVVERAQGHGIHAIVTVFCVELVKDARRLPWDAYKSASPDLINRPLLEAISSAGQPMILSTGTSTLDEVTRAIGWLGSIRDRLAVLQCVSSYPTPIEQAALGGIAAIQSGFGGPVGYSDHTSGVETGAMAVAAGACLLEKHLTYDRGAVGPDHAASLDAEGFAQYVNLARSAAPGSERHEPEKRVLEIEADVRLVSRQSLTTACAMDAGHTIAHDDLTMKRPGSGIEPFRMSEVIGRVTARSIEADVPLTDDDLRD